MPVHACQEGGKPGYRWGSKGKCYTYTRGNEASRKRAHAKAERQGRAARASGYRGSIKKSLDDVIESIKSINKMLSDRFK